MKDCWPLAEQFAASESVSTDGVQSWIQEGTLRTLAHGGLPRCHGELQGVWVRAAWVGETQREKA
jgi:hypothetical protein